MTPRGAVCVWSVCGPCGARTKGLPTAIGPGIRKKPECRRGRRRAFLPRRSGRPPRRLHFCRTRRGPGLGLSLPAGVRVHRRRARRGGGGAWVLPLPLFSLSGTDINGMALCLGGGVSRFSYSYSDFIYPIIYEFIYGKNLNKDFTNTIRGGGAPFCESFSKKTFFKGWLPLIP